MFTKFIYYYIISEYNYSLKEDWHTTPIQLDYTKICNIIYNKEWRTPNPGQN